MDKTETSSQNSTLCFDIIKKPLVCQYPYGLILQKSDYVRVNWLGRHQRKIQFAWITTKRKKCPIFEYKFNIYSL